jgi:hypothetical protein
MTLAKLTAPVVLAAALASACGLDNAFDPLERDPGEAKVTITVDECDQDKTTEIVNMTFTVESQEAYDSVLVDGKLKDATGTVVGNSSTSVSNVKPGEPTQAVMVLSPSGDYEKPLNCEASLNFAQRPIG